MAKYTYEFKKEVVQAYFNGEGGVRKLAKRYGIPCKSSILKWINAYKTLGEFGLEVSKKHVNYSLEFKRNVVKLYLKGNTSYQELANKFEIRNPGTIGIWVNKFQHQGLEGLKSNKREGSSSMTNIKIVKPVKPEKKEYSQDILDENKMLREKVYWLELELDFQKKKNELRKKRAIKMKKQPE